MSGLESLSAGRTPQPNSSSQITASRNDAGTPAERQIPPDDRSLGTECQNSDEDSLEEEGRPTALDTTALFHPWNPGWLRWYVLSLVAFVGLCCIISLALLYYFSEKYQGICTEDESHQYAWKYGPTVFLTVLAALWQQIDYTCRSLEPWRNLASGPSSETDTLLLDYVSSNALDVFVRALKKRQWAVAASSMGSTLFLVAIAFSTSLLVLSPVTITTHDAIIPLVTKFSAKTYDGSFLEEPVQAWYGTELQNLPMDMGVTSSIAYAQIDIKADGMKNSTITAEVPAFVPRYNCEVASLRAIRYFEQDKFSGVWSPPSFQAEYVSENCRISERLEFNPDPTTGEVEQRVLWAQMNNNYVYCDNGTVWSVHNGSTLYTSDIHLMRMFDQRYDQIIKPISDPAAYYYETANVTAYNASIASASVVVCHPTYSMDIARVTVDTSRPPNHDVIEVQLLDQPQGMLAGLSNGNVSGAFGIAVDSALWTLPELPAVAAAAEVSSVSTKDNFWKMMSLQNGHSSLEPFLDPDVLRDTAEKFFRSVASQFGHQKLATNEASSLAGTQISSQNRLQVKFVPALVVGIHFCFVLLLLVTIFCTRAWNIVPRDPTCIAATATLLVENRPLAEKMGKQGHASDLDLGHYLYKSSYRSQPVQGPVLAFNILRETTSITTDLTSDRDMEYWKAFPISWTYTVLLGVLACALIAVLQVLQHLTDRLQGIASIGSSTDLVRQLSTVIPAIIIILVSQGYAATYGVISSLVPYSAIRKHEATADRSIMMQTTGKLHLVNFFNGARHKSIGLVAISIAAFLGTFLTSIVAALYQIVPYSPLVMVNLTTSDWFDYDFNTLLQIGVPHDNGAGLGLGLFEQQNASYPPFVYDGLVYPHFDLTSNNKLLTTSGKLVANIPATRASLRCDFLAPIDFSLTFFPLPDFPGLNINAVLHLPEECHFYGAPYIPSTIPSLYIQNRHDASYSSYILDTLWGWNTIGRQTDSNCYSVSFIFGKFQYQNTSKEDVLFMNCFQYLETVDTTTTFLPSMLIDSFNPPIVHESTRRPIAPNSPYRLSDVLADDLPLFNIPAYGKRSNNDTIKMDPFYQSVISGPNGVPAPELLSNRKTFFNATQALYRKYIALLIHYNMRKPLNSSSPLEQYQANIVNLTPLRLVQNSTSSLILQILLATMLVCFVTAQFLIPMRKVLHHNPNTIAGVMTLLVGSELCTSDILPPGAAFISNGDLKKVLAGYMFSLGWFTREDGTKRFGIDIGRAEKSA